MSKLEQLINKFCPNGVERMPLQGAIISLTTGLNPRQFFALNTDDAKNYYVTIKEMRNGTVVFNDKTDRINDAALKLCNNRSNLEAGDILFSGTGTIGEVSIVEETPNNWNIKEGVYSIKPNTEKVLSRFLMHLLQSKEMRLSYLSKAAGGTVKSVPMKEMRKLIIPLPPLPVQREIVRILDNFTELTAELTARKQQYEYYRDNLLTFGDEVEFKTLGECLKIRNGKDYKQFENGDVPVYGSGGIMTHIDTCISDKPSVLIPRKGSIDKLYYVDVPFWTVDTIFYTEIYTHIIVPKFVFYYLQKEHLEQYNTAGGVPSLTQTILNKLPIPVPSLPEQERIVAILDRFDALCSNISIGLPAEIKARQQQYEYYRDKLLTFKEKEVPQDE